jgi:chromosome segregation ATPase
LWLQTLNWRHNPNIEKQISASRLRTKQLESEIDLLRSESAQIESETETLRKESLRVRREIEQIENENARLSELNSELDAIVFSSAINSTPTKPTPSESEM